MRGVFHWLRRDPLGRLYAGLTVTVWVAALAIWAHGGAQ